jgi:hypothetical protein
VVGGLLKWYGGLVGGALCVVSIGKVVENGVMVVCEKTNGQCELRSSMRHDKLGDMGCFVPMRKEVYY